MLEFNILMSIIAWNIICSIFSLKNKVRPDRLYCGIVGYSGKGNFNLDKIKLLLTYNTLTRGNDALGIYTPVNGLAKKAGKPIDLIPKVVIQDDNYFIGHVRASTVGGNIDKNAHPFRHGNLIGVMNGTTDNHWKLCSKYGLKMMDYDVDSDVLFAIIHKEKTFDVLGEINGGCAIIVADTDSPSVMYVYRNSERPLFKGVIGEDMYISSIEESLNIIGCSNVIQFEENVLYTIKKGKITSSKIIKKNQILTGKNLDISGNFPVEFKNIENYHLLGRYIQFKYPNCCLNGTGRELTVDKFYYVKDTGKNSSYSVIINNDKGEKIEVSSYAFDRIKAFPRKGDPVYIMTNLTKLGKGKDRGKKLFDKGDIGYLKCYEDNKSVLVKVNPEDKYVWMLDTENIRPLTKEEEDKWFEDQLQKEVNRVEREKKKNIKFQSLPEVDTTNEPIVSNEILPVGPDIVRGDENQEVLFDKDGGKLTDNVPEGELENDDEDYICITNKEFKDMADKINDFLGNMKEAIEKQFFYPRIKEDLIKPVLELEDYVDKRVEHFITT